MLLSNRIALHIKAFPGCPLERRHLFHVQRAKYPVASIGQFCTKLLGFNRVRLCTCDWGLWSPTKPPRQLFLSKAFLKITCDDFVPFLKDKLSGSCKVPKSRTMLFPLQLIETNLYLIVYFRQCKLGDDATFTKHPPAVVPSRTSKFHLRFRLCGEFTG